MKQRVIGLTGGGTAGHVWPHFALFDTGSPSPLSHAFADGKIGVVYFGSVTGMERDLVTRTMGSSWTYIGLPTGKLRRYFDWRNFTDPFRVAAGFFSALVQLRRHRVNVLFSKGGFVSAPVVWAAWILRIPVIIHESDVTPALATLLSLPFCSTCVVAFSQTRQLLPKSFQQKVDVLGLPLRASLFGGDKQKARAFFEIKSQDPVLLVFGGSLGAEVINRTVREALSQLVQNFEIIHIVGVGKGFAPEDAVRQSGRYRQFEFLGPEMAFVYSVADIALSRAGASSLFELAAARIPMVLVPLDLDQSRGDQIVNAEVFAHHQWAKVIREKSFDSGSLIVTLRELMQERETYVERLKLAPGPEAAAKVADLLWSALQ